MIFLTRDGRADGGQDAAWTELRAAVSRGDCKLLLHLHGGLVDEAAGRGIAARLVKAADAGGFGLDASWTPIFVVWRTGAMDALRRNWLDLVRDERLYRLLVRKLIEFLLRRYDLPPGVARGSALAGLNSSEIERRLLGQGDRRDPFADVERAGEDEGAEAAGARGPMRFDTPDGELALQFQNELNRDPDFALAAGEIDGWANRNAPGRSAGVRGARQTSYDRLNSALREEIEAARPTEGAARGVAGVVGFLIQHAGRVALRCFRRFRNHRDHGLQATAVEEVLREFYGDFIGAKVWGAMVGDAAEHFDAEGFGLAFLEALPTDRPIRLVVTAHSAGSIWASHLLKAVAARRPNLTIDLVLLAPAVRHDLFVEAVTAAGDQLRRCRMFTMSDALERKDAVLGHDYGYLYPCSLLYLVSGLFEDAENKAYVDAPILGMQRFEGATWMTAGETAAAQSIVRFWSTVGRGIVHSPVDGVCVADVHGDFDTDRATLASVLGFCNA